MVLLVFLKDLSEKGVKFRNNYSLKFTNRHLNNRQWLDYIYFNKYILPRTAKSECALLVLSDLTELLIIKK